jgi:hypothetical protein
MSSSSHYSTATLPADLMQLQPSQPPPPVNKHPTGGQCGCRHCPCKGPDWSTMVKCEHTVRLPGEPKGVVVRVRIIEPLPARGHDQQQAPALNPQPLCLVCALCACFPRCRRRAGGGTGSSRPSCEARGAQGQLAVAGLRTLSTRAGLNVTPHPSTTTIPFVCARLAGSTTPA